MTRMLITKLKKCFMLLAMRALNLSSYSVQVCTAGFKACESQYMLGGFGDIRCLNVSWACEAHFASLLQTWLQLVEATPQSAFETNLLYSGLLLLPRHRQVRSLQRNHKACALFCNTMGPPIQRNSKRPCIRTPGFQWFRSMLFYLKYAICVWSTHRTSPCQPDFPNMP